MICFGLGSEAQKSEKQNNTSRFSQGAKDSAQAEIRQLTNEWNQALINRDSLTLDKILAPEFSLNGSTQRSGWMNNTLHHFTTDSAEILGPLHISFYGQAARSEGILYWKADWDGKPRVNTEFLITDIWVKRNGRWQVLLRMSDIYKNR